MPAIDSRYCRSIWPGLGHQELERHAEADRVEAARLEERGVVVVEAVGRRGVRRELLDEVHAPQHHDPPGRVGEPAAVVRERRDRVVRRRAEPGGEPAARAGDDDPQQEHEEAAQGSTRGHGGQYAWTPTRPSTLRDGAMPDPGARDAEREITPTGLGAGGDAVARDADGSIVSVHGGIPGERVRVRVMARRHGVVHARAVEVLDPSPDRVRPPCPEVEHGCGACQWQHIGLDAQRRLKRDARRRRARAAGRHRVGRCCDRPWRSTRPASAPPSTPRWRTGARASGGTARTAWSTSTSAWSPIRSSKSSSSAAATATRTRCCSGAGRAPASASPPRCPGQ